MIRTPLTIGKSDYDYRALLGIALQALTVAGGVILANAAHVSPRVLTGTVLVLAAVGGFGSVLTALGKPIVREMPKDDA